MSFNTLKSQHGTRLIQAVAIYPNACKYSTDEALAKGETVVQADYSDSYTGNIAINGGEASFFSASSNSYLKLPSGEIAKCLAVDDTTVNITSRAQFGTTAEALTNGDSVRVIHGGEADGSCRGYPQRPDGKGCSNSDSFDKDVTREFLFTDVQLVAGERYYNGLQSISHSASILKPGKEIAKNASVSVTILDNEDGDLYAVPYPSQRTTRSTVLRKLAARTGGYLRNRKMVVYSGFTVGNTFNPDECISREYIIDDFDISNTDSARITGIDPLILTEEVKSKTHDVSAGTLLVALTDASTQIELKNALAGEYGADNDAGTVIIDSELIDYTVNDSAAGILDIVTRGVAGSEQKDHSLNASVQKCLVLTDFNPVDEIVSMLQNRTSIESRFYDDYTAVAVTTPNSNGKVYVTKPETVKVFINTIIQSWAENNISLYFDELAKKIRIKAIGDFEQQPITLTDTDLKLDSVDVENDYASQITRASIGFAPFDASKKTDEENSSIIFQSINLGVETIGTLEPQEKDTFYTKFLTNSDTDVSIAVGGISRTANVNTKPPQTYTFTIDYESYGDIAGGTIEEGEIINVNTELSIDDDGLPMSQNLQITSIKDDMKNKQVRVTAVTYQDIISEADFDFIIDENKEDYDLSADFAPTEAGEYIVFIASNVTIGATSVDNPAFTTGTQAAGVTLKIVHRGQILGAGGKGATTFTAAIAPDPNDVPNVYVEIPGEDGFTGGDAISLTVDCEIDVSQGVIYSGGGGAPSYPNIASTVNGIFLSGGNAGSGGQGYVGGAGGNGGIATIAGGDTDTGLNGIDGSRSAAGSLGSISAGDWGEDSGSDDLTGDAGVSGYAILSNGNSVILIGDNNATIRGKRDF